MQYDKALECYDNAIQAQPSHAEAHCNKGVILKNQGRLEEAIAAYHRALEATPDFQIVQTNLAIALTEKATLMKNDGKLEESEVLQLSDCLKASQLVPSLDSHGAVNKSKTKKFLHHCQGL